MPPRSVTNEDNSLTSAAEQQEPIMLPNSALMATVLLERNESSKPIGDMSIIYMSDPKDSKVNISDDDSTLNNTHRYPEILSQTRLEEKEEKKNKNKEKRNKRGWSTELKTPYLNVSSLLQSSGHFETLAPSLARAYTDQPPEICSLQPAIRQQRQKSDQVHNHIYKEPLEGLMYVKVPKTASSTLAGVNARIAMRQAKRLYGNNSTSTTTCTHFEDHMIGAAHYYGNRDPSRSFLWSSIRDPASRALSRIFYYQISQTGHPSTDETV
jgi:hypothetical protein